ncbi:hypothetical protein KIN20_003965 [Parelaphostrongylus tenuis]|uniref:Uncharacterized protein n=1 Tax=Parelaphostrongylus tenuis TaxID=148309 RepID=A0AAD5MJ68_PARTN|nr:hypothetical protein KIN20_003965 [Parelaphostrongylus tenuis]
MFQIGRSSEEQIDFTIVDTWLASGSQIASSSGASGPSRTRPGCDPHKMVSSTISRYACRILVDRENYDKAFVYAAGFDSVKNIFLGEKATKWMKKNGEMDGLTTNGILILHPNRNCEELLDDDIPSMYVWREVSVDGDIYTLRETRSSSTRGKLVPEETNMLQDGSLIDSVWCDTIVEDGGWSKEIANRSGIRNGNINLGYLRCGHVQGKHEWGYQASSNGQQSYKCPICLAESERVIQLTMGMESSFHLDSGNLDHAFNPCGHVASLSTVRFWSRIPLPHGTNSFHPESWDNSAGAFPHTAESEISPQDSGSNFLIPESQTRGLGHSMAEIERSLRHVLDGIPGVNTIFLTDRDGVIVLSVGEELRSRASLVSSLQATQDQTGKLVMGSHVGSVFFYENSQLVILNVPPFTVFVVAIPTANTASLLQLREQLKPLLQYVETVIPGNNFA